MDMVNFFPVFSVLATCLEIQSLLEAYMNDDKDLEQFPDEQLYGQGSRLIT